MLRLGLDSFVYGLMFKLTLIQGLESKSRVR